MRLPSINSMIKSTRKLPPSRERAERLKDLQALKECRALLRRIRCLIAQKQREGA